LTRGDISRVNLRRPFVSFRCFFERRKSGKEGY